MQKEFSIMISVSNRELLNMLSLEEAGRLLIALCDHGAHINGEDVREPDLSDQRNELVILYSRFKRDIDYGFHKMIERSERSRKASQSRWMQTDADGCGRMRTDADGCGRMRTDADGCGRMRTDADGCERMQTDADGCERMRTDADGCNINKNIIKEKIKEIYKEPVREDRERGFSDLIVEYGREHDWPESNILDFIDYWTSLFKGDQMRWEHAWITGAFDVPKRISTWMRKAGVKPVKKSAPVDDSSFNLVDPEVSQEKQAEYLKMFDEVPDEVR